jgi:XTP/dITP diphosphohydrolase
VQIVIATKNRGKVLEITGFFNGLSGKKAMPGKITWKTFQDFKDFPDVREGSKSFLENAIKKARKVAGYTGMVTLADDSGLEVDMLGGEPGVISSVYAGTCASDGKNREKLLGKLKDVRDLEKRTARFICKMVLWDPGRGMLKTSDGVCEGRIGFIERGKGGFGYDPIFIPDGYEKTMAQLSQQEKNRISHRGKALKEMMVFLEDYLAAI